MGKLDPRLERYLWWLLDELVRLDDEVIGWDLWSKAFCDSLCRRRRHEAWRFLQAAGAWLAQIETGGQS